ncbi:hypothetical protein QFC22_003594 [Naganishia vaughanmartiniae]|uniref:Uncharacterized protein n=1 Tax=Naganishia vaughanmartiniae TaxID=1424756 RepID=A0ACC2X641_9TREE|nr:hypothetical protein QFC22_003594 [Naganishia vaughanmartiniae]
MTDGQETEHHAEKETEILSPGPSIQDSVVNHPLQEDSSSVKLESTEVEVSRDTTEAVSDPVTPSTTSETAVNPEETPVEEQQASTTAKRLLPHRHRRKQPKKGILKPPPPPVKPGLGGKLRDALGSIHPKFLDYAGPIGNTTAASVVEALPPSISVPVNNLASNVIEGVGVVGGAAAAVVGSWGGRFGKLVSNAAAGATSAAQGTGSGDSSHPVSSGWKFPSRSAASTAARASNVGGSSADKDLPKTPSKAAPNQTTPSSATSTLQVPHETTTIVIETDTYKPLKRASFILPIISITYPISSANPPYSDKMVQDRRKVEEEATKVMRSSAGPTFWDGGKLGELYDIACQGREESARAGIKEALSAMQRFDKPGDRQLLLTSAPTPAPGAGKNSSKTTTFVHVDPPLGKYAAQAFADVLSIRWGLSKLALQEGILECDDARNLRFLDLSSNNLDKKSIEYLAQALRQCTTIPETTEAAPASLLASKRSGDGERSDEEEDEQNYGPIPHTSLTTMLKDTRTDTPESTVALQTLRLDDCNLRAVSIDLLAIAIMIRDWPDDATTGRNPFGTTDRQGATVLFSETDHQDDSEDEHGHAHQPPEYPLIIPPSVTPQRLGQLVTLDLKRNDIRGGVNYIAQVLKRNQHLKVLNLSENRIDAAGLASLAEALIVALRHTFPANTTLRRLFLNDTQMSDEAAIAMAEALSDANHLLHIDLTDNNITLAGAMALAGSLRSNTSIRCLDLTIPPNDADLSEISQSILQSCIRNTEAALSAKGTKLSNGTQDAVWAPIKNSSLVRRAKEAEQDRIISEAAKTVDTPAAIARTETFTLKPSGVIRAAAESIQYAEQLIERQAQSESFTLDSTEKQRCMAALERSRALLERLADLIQETEEPSSLEQLLGLNDQLTTVIPKVEHILVSADKRVLVATTKPFAKPALSNAPAARSLSINTAPIRRHMKVPSLDAHGPNFSITNSDDDDDDDDSDAEELASAGPVSLNLNRTSIVRSGTPTLGNLGAFGLSLHNDSGHNKSHNTGAQGDPWLADACASPLERVNKEWMAEEGEIFRKGQKLGVAEEDSELGDVDDPGSSLKQKILETEVERTPHHLPEDYLLNEATDVVDSRNDMNDE